jgi:hypothetical protein
MQVGTLTTTFDLKAYITKIKVNDTAYYFCGYPDCRHQGRFDTRRQAISHVRCIHLKEKPFKCMTWYAYLLPRASVLLDSYSGTFFARKQDATRHVNTMNEGKAHECTVWYADPCHPIYAPSYAFCPPVIMATLVKITAKTTRSAAS